jgi:hypothetical protein
MDKYRFSIYQRYAVFKSFKGICHWCGELVDFLSFEVDHVLPESLENKQAKLNELRDYYDLIPEFNINNYENWAPIHSSCNKLKGYKIYKAGFIRDILEKCAKNKAEAQKIEIRFKKEPEKARLLTEFEIAIQKEAVSMWELQNFLLKDDIMDTDDEDLIKIRLKLQENEEYKAQYKSSRLSTNNYQTNTGCYQ